MQPNMSETQSDLTMEPLDIPPSRTYPVFFLGLMTYCIILVFNLTVLLTIILNKQLHKPMYLLLTNLTINDMLGATAFFPQLLSSILLQSRSISYPACILQTVVVHVYGCGSLNILMFMAYDRYVAICHPLRYQLIMTPSILFKMIAAIWLIPFPLVGILCSLLTRFKFCRSVITDMFCNNPSLMKLICEDTSINNYYGLFITFCANAVTLCALAFTYIQILLTCLFNKHSDTKSKAVRTCGTHLVVFILYELTTLFAVLAHRFNEVSPFLRRCAGISVLVFPPILNPLIYGFNMNEIRSKVIYSLNKKVSPLFIQRSTSQQTFSR
ncbi:putative gustatory receptor clone PTE01 [Scleropages formosus]|nr:putative gustatory receptor clone PTE01 [Scleropages formosus]